MPKAQLQPIRKTDWRAIVTIALAVPILVVLSLFFYLRPAEQTATAQVAVVATGDYPPFSSEQLEGSGIAAAIVSLAFKEMGYQVDLKFMPWPLVEINTQQSATNQGVRAAFPYAKTAERERDFYFSDPILEVETSLFYLPAKTPEITAQSKLSDLRRYRRLSIAGYRYLPQIEAIPKLAQTAEDNIAAFQQLLENPQVELVAEATAVGNQVLATSFPRFRHQVKTLPVYTSPLYLIASKRNPYNRELILEFNKALATITPEQRQAIQAQVLTQINEQNQVLLHAYEASGYLLGYLSARDRPDGQSAGKPVRLPAGTRAIVEAWPPSYLNPSALDASRSSQPPPQVDWVKVRILNGPLRDESLYVDSRAVELYR